MKLLYRVVHRNAGHLTVHVFAGEVEEQRPLAGVLVFRAGEFDEIAELLEKSGTVERSPIPSNLSR